MKKTLIFMASSLLMLAGCKTFYESTRSAPPQLTAFLPDHKLLVKQPPEFPFYYFWEKNNVDWNKYDKVYVAPVNTVYLLKDTWWESVDPKALVNIKKDIPGLAEYMRNKFISELKKIEARGNFKVVDNPDIPGTVSLETALTKLTPTKAELNYLGSAAGFFVPGAGLAASIASSGNVSLECKLLDPKTGELLLMFADREDDPSALINVAGFCWYNSAKGNIDMWARQTAAMAVVSKLEDMRRDFPFQLINY
jgi:hypothetical protein